MIEGLTLHRALGGEPRNPQSIRDGIRRIIDHRADGNGSAPKCATH